ncbi:hypothetical protein [Streptomyces sp. CC228A]|uniref:hypothetical protein n=1 Tax=Streptomyces sp. CC228A TaxID=2898186 RepID=UPI001F38DF5C|nr:hypothetical protein [Streptomyces sp. CC228A]
MARWPKRPHADHITSAARMLRQPGEWVRVHSYRASYTADSTAHRIRTGDLILPYQPAGAFEARVLLSDDECVVYGRYVGLDRVWADAVRSLAAGAGEVR